MKPGNEIQTEEIKPSEVKEPSIDMESPEDMTVEEADQVYEHFMEEQFDQEENDEPQPGDLYPEYQKLMDSGEYDSVEEMCNDLMLNYEDVYYTPDEFDDEDDVDEE